MKALLRVTVVALLPALLSGCAFRAKRREQIVRQLHYEELLAKVQPGMTRRQLYAILPPKGVPKVRPIFFLRDHRGANYPVHLESHQLDTEFSLAVSYRINESYALFVRTPSISRFYRQRRGDILDARPTLNGP